MSAIQPAIMEQGYLLTGEFVGNFVHVFEMLQFEGSKPEYSIEMVFEPTDPTIQVMVELINKVAREKWGNNIPANMKSPIRDGNQKAHKYPELTNKYSVKASDKNRQPLVIDRNKAEIIDANQVYSGAKYRAVLDAYAYESRGSYGVAFGLKILQKLEDGTPLSGGRVDPAILPELPPMEQAPTNPMFNQIPNGFGAPQGQPMSQPMQPAGQFGMPQGQPQGLYTQNQGQPMGQPMQPQGQPMGAPQGQPMGQPMQPMGQPGAGEGFVPTPNGGTIDLNNI